MASNDETTTQCVSKKTLESMKALPSGEWGFDNVLKVLIAFCQDNLDTFEKWKKPEKKS